MVAYLTSTLVDKSSRKRQCLTWLCCILALGNHIVYIPNVYNKFLVSLSSLSSPLRAVVTYLYLMRSTRYMYLGKYMCVGWM